MWLQTHEVEVEAGPHGFARFVDSVRALFGISADLSMDLNFDCVEPTSGAPANFPCSAYHGGLWLHARPQMCEGSGVRGCDSRPRLVRYVY